MLLASVVSTALYAFSPDVAALVTSVGLDVVAVMQILLASHVGAILLMVIPLLSASGTNGVSKSGRWFVLKRTPVGHGVLICFNIVNMILSTLLAIIAAVLLVGFSKAIIFAKELNTFARLAFAALLLKDNSSGSTLPNGLMIWARETITMHGGVNKPLVMTYGRLTILNPLAEQDVALTSQMHTFSVFGIKSKNFNYQSNASSTTA